MSAAAQEQRSPHWLSRARSGAIRDAARGSAKDEASPTQFSDAAADHASEAEPLSIGPAALEVEGGGGGENEDYDDGNGDISVLQDNIMKQSRTIDDFTRIIADWRNERERRQRCDGASQRTSFHGGAAEQAERSGASTSAAGGRGLQIKGSALSLRRESERSRLSLDVDVASQYSYEPSSVGEQDDGAASVSASPTASSSPLALHAEGSSKNIKVRCTCCCGRGTRRCKRARRATREWSEVESDLRLAAEIGQALLRRNDSLQSEVLQNQQEYSSRIDSLMKKLSFSIREASQLEKQREQSELNLEAADASNRSLVRELDDCRRELAKLRGANARNSGLENHLERLLREVGDLKQEVAEERKKSKRLEKMQTDLKDDLRIARIEGKRQTPSDGDRALRREEMKRMAETRLAASTSTSAEESNQWAEGVVAENEQMQEENRQLREMLEARTEELTQMREEWNQRIEVSKGSQGTERSDKAMLLRDLPFRTFGVLSSEIVEEGSSSFRSSSDSPSQSVQSGLEQHSNALLSPTMTSHFAHSPAASLASADTAETTIEDGEGAGKQERASNQLSATSASAHKTGKEMRTAQLMALIEMVQRIFSRLSSADVDTLSKRLQRQNLTGDVGHLARTTVNGILRDVDGLREHFRRGMEAESRSRDTDTISMGSKNSGKSERDSDSLVARKEFFALIKTFRELFVEMAMLRKTVNEVSLQPQNAARILQEHMGVSSAEDKGVGGWIGRLFAAAPLPGVMAPAPSSGPLQPLPAAGGRPSSSRVTSGPQLTTRASAAVLSSAVAVEVKGTHASEQVQSSSQLNSGKTATSPANEAPMPPHARPRPILERGQRSLSRTQSRNLSGLFVGSRSATPNDGDGESRWAAQQQMGPAHARLVSEQQTSHNHRLSRIVDDDEVSIHQGFNPKRGLRPRNLSDSSIRTTYLDDEDRLGAKRSSNHAPAAISRIITPSTLSLQASSAVDSAVVHSSLTSGKRSARVGGDAAAGSEPAPTTSFLSGIAAPRSTVSKALSFLAGPTTSPQPPSLRATPSQAKLSLAASEARGPK